MPYLLSPLESGCSKQPELAYDFQRFCNMGMQFCVPSVLQESKLLAKSIAVALALLYTTLGLANAVLVYRETGG